MPGEPPGSSDPLDPDGLVDRAAEAAAIRRMMDGAPLVTVTGLPGVGKTAVSLAAARTAAAGFADGSLLLRRLGQDQEFAARHKRWQDDRRPHQCSPAGK